MKIKNYIVNEKFYSKRNLVYKITSFLENSSNRKYKSFINLPRELENSKIIFAVLKRYSKDNMHLKSKEVSILSKLKDAGLTVPRVYCVNEDTIFMEYLEGATILDIILSKESSNSNCTQILHDLYCWLCDFYAASGNNIIFGDVNLRNFILKDGLIYGIDFEECRVGKKEEDMGKICAYLLTYNPSFTHWKINNTKDFFMMLIDKGLNRKELLNEIEKEFAAMNKRRNENYVFEHFAMCL